MSDRQSEGTRGVNTYVRPDGTEVEVSVTYDRSVYKLFEIRWVLQVHLRSRAETGRK